MSLPDLLPYLPATNATLNSLSAIFLLSGYRLIKRQRIEAHRKCMLAAFVTSTLFLASYLTYHFGRAYYFNAGPTVFRNPEWFRPIYLGILLSHTLLAVVVVPLALTSLILGLKRRDQTHRKISRWTWPVWMYVSVTGVLIYLLLYQIFPQEH
jgi:putative membrane protein